MGTGTQYGWRAPLLTRDDPLCRGRARGPDPALRPASSEEQMVGFALHREDDSFLVAVAEVVPERSSALVARTYYERVPRVANRRPTDLVTVDLGS